MDDAALREEAKDRIEHLDGKMLLYATAMLEGIEERANLSYNQYMADKETKANWPRADISQIDWNSFGHLTSERAAHVEEYMEEMRDGDRL